MDSEVSQFWGKGGFWGPLFVSKVTSASSAIICVSVMFFIKIGVGCLKNSPVLTGRVDVASRSSAFM